MLILCFGYLVMVIPHRLSNPNHVFESAGCFEVSLIRFADECSDTATISCLEVFPIPEVEINIENQFNCTLPTTILLEGNNSAPGKYSWEFTDGTSMHWLSDSNLCPHYN